jgi:hypothetical protein
VKTLKEAMDQGKKISLQEKHLFVYEKAKCQDHPSPRKYVCYRGWLDMDSKSVGVISIEEWQKRRKR